MSHAGLQAEFGTYGYSHTEKGQYRFYTHCDSIHYRRFIMKDNIIIQTIFKPHIPTELILIIFRGHRINIGFIEPTCIYCYSCYNPYHKI